MKRLLSIVSFIMLVQSPIVYSGGKICYVERCTYCLKDQCKSCFNEGDVTVIEEEQGQYILANVKSNESSAFKITNVDRLPNYTVYSTDGLGAVLKVANQDMPVISVQKGDFVEFRTSNLHSFLSSGQCQTVD